MPETIEINHLEINHNIAIFNAFSFLDYPAKLQFPMNICPDDYVTLSMQLRVSKLRIVSLCISSCSSLIVINLKNFIWGRKKQANSIICDVYLFFHSIKIWRVIIITVTWLINRTILNAYFVLRINSIESLEMFDIYFFFK